MIFDTHAHYDAAHYDEDRAGFLEKLRESGVGRVVNISNGWKDLLATLELIRKYPWIYGAVGIHPCEIQDLNEERLEMIREYTRFEKVVAVGEIGLDYYWVKEEDERERQKDWFIRQLTLAKETDMPVVIHSRDAAQDTFDIMKRYHSGSSGGVIHCYSGSAEMARDYVKMGYFLGIGGVVTFKNSKTLKRVVKEIPLKYLVLETDAPYLSPVPYRGKRNSSAYLSYVAEAIAKLKEISRQEVEEITWDNAMTLYRMER